MPQYQGRGRLKPKHTYRDGILFDSAHEAAVYDVLSSINGLDVNIHPKVAMKPATANYPATYKELDFLIDFTPYIDAKAYIDAKGLIDESFVRDVKYLEFFQRHVWKKLLIVFPDNAIETKTGKSSIRSAEKLGLKWVLRRNLRNHIINEFGMQGL